MLLHKFFRTGIYFHSNLSSESACGLACRRADIILQGLFSHKDGPMKMGMGRLGKEKKEDGKVYTTTGSHCQRDVCLCLLSKHGVFWQNASVETAF